MCGQAFREGERVRCERGGNRYMIRWINRQASFIQHTSSLSLSSSRSIAVKAALLYNVSGRGLGPGTAVVRRPSRSKSMGTKGAAGPNPPTRLVNGHLLDISVPRHSYSRVNWASLGPCGHHLAIGGLQRAKFLHARTARFGRPCAEIHARVPK